jgi:hypothetical protein
LAARLYSTPLLFAPDKARTIEAVLRACVTSGGVPAQVIREGGTGAL